MVLWMCLAHTHISARLTTDIKGAFDWSDLAALDPGPCLRLVGFKFRSTRL